MTHRIPIRLLVVELDHHADLLAKLCLMLIGEKFTLTVLTRERIWRSCETTVRHPDIKLLLMPDDVEAGQFLADQREVFLSCDVVLFNTMEKHHRAFVEFGFPRPSFVRIHNTNAELRPAASLRLDPLTILPSLLHALRRGLFAGEWADRRRFYEKVDRYLFANERITDYAKRCRDIDAGKIAPPVLPLTHIGPDTPRPSNDQVTVVIPGMIDRKRKDHGVVLAACRLLEGRLQKPVHLHLLGKPSRKYGATMVRAFEGLSVPRLTVTTYRQYVAQAEFDHVLAQADILLAPIRIKTHHSKYWEIYGLTKVSGVENDILRYRKPALVPQDYAVSKALENVCFRYQDSGDLADALARLSCDSQDRSSAQAFESLQQFSPTAIAQEFAACCRDLSRSRGTQ